MRAGDFSEFTGQIFDPRTATGTNATRTAFGNNMIPANRMDPVMARMIQSYPLPVLPGLANNQFTNPSLVQNYNYGNVRADANLSAKDTLFLRYSPQKAFVATPTGFGYRNVPGLSIPQPPQRERQHHARGCQLQ
jgi:hypothetical protein